MLREHENAVAGSRNSAAVIDVAREGGAVEHRDPGVDGRRDGAAVIDAAGEGGDGFDLDAVAAGRDRAGADDAAAERRDVGGAMPGGAADVDAVVAAGHGYDAGARYAA